MIKELRLCQTKEDIENYFNKYQIYDINIKAEHLYKAIYSPVIFTNPVNASIEERYKLLIKLFLDGKWRMKKSNYLNKLSFEVFKKEVLNK